MITSSGDVEWSGTETLYERDVASKGCAQVIRACRVGSSGQLGARNGRGSAEASRGEGTGQWLYAAAASAVSQCMQCSSEPSRLAVVAGRASLMVVVARPRLGHRGRAGAGRPQQLAKVTKDAWLLRRKAHRLIEGLPLPAEPGLALASPGSAAWWIHCAPMSLQGTTLGIQMGNHKSTAGHCS